MTPTGLPKPDENARFKHLRGQKGNAGGNSYEAIRGHIAPNEKKEQLKPRENDTVASSVPSEMTPTGLEPVLPP